MTGKEIAKQLRSAASAIEHGRSVTFRKKLAAVAKDVNLWPGDGENSAFTRVASAAVKEARNGFTQAEIDALGAALDLAFEDQENYLTSGNAPQDYGSEWSEAKREKQSKFRLIASVTEKLGIAGERERWEGLADQLNSN
jgi:hypothetical protein